MAVIAGVRYGVTLKDEYKKTPPNILFVFRKDNEILVKGN